MPLVKNYLWLHKFSFNLFIIIFCFPLLGVTATLKTNFFSHFSKHTFGFTDMHVHASSRQRLLCRHTSLSPTLVFHMPRRIILKLRLCVFSIQFFQCQKILWSRISNCWRFQDDVALLLSCVCKALWAKCEALAEPLNRFNFNNYFCLSTCFR